MVEHVIWDWNGTLLDDVDACVASLNDILRARELREVSREEYCDTFKFPVRDYYVELGFDFEHDNWDQVATDYHVFYRKHSKHAALRAGVLSVLERMKNEGMPMSILSACESETLEEMVREREIGRFFSSLYGLPNYYAGSKLSAGRAAMKSIHVDPPSMLLIGDTAHDYEVADELGCECLLVCGGHQSEHRLRKCGCDIVTSINTIAEHVLEKK
jgi:phosphoglycolate phosphatase